MDDREGKKGEESRFKMWNFSVSLWGPQAKCDCCLQLRLSAPSMFKVSLL